MKFAHFAATLAGFSLTLSPAHAAGFPQLRAAEGVAGSTAWSVEKETRHNHRWRGYRRGGVDAGDILTGVLILGGIAAIANAAKRGNEARRYPQPDPRYPEDRRAGGWDSADSRGLDRAVDMCVAEVERAARVDRVDSANRTAAGWRIEGALFDGRAFTCSLGEDGRIEAIDYSGEARRGADARDPRDEDNDRWDGAANSRDDAQYDDDTYMSARARADAGTLPQSGETTTVEVGESYPGAGV